MVGELNKKKKKAIHPQGCCAEHLTETHASPSYHPPAEEALENLKKKLY